MRLRRDLVGELPALRSRCERFDRALREVRRRCASGAPETLEWVLCAGAVLFNLGLFFEVHELLEPSWVRAQGPLRIFLQGLIQVAVGLHHHGQRNLRGAASLLEDGNAKLTPFCPAAFGVELDQFCRRIVLLDQEVRAQIASGDHQPLVPPPLVLQRGSS